jgi:hypothetical protein
MATTDRKRRERCGVDARSKIQSARMWLDNVDPAEYGPQERAAMAIKRAREARTLAAEFCARVELEAESIFSAASQPPTA